MASDDIPWGRRPTRAVANTRAHPGCDRTTRYFATMKSRLLGGRRSARIERLAPAMKEKALSIRATAPFRADHVGSLLRPPELTRARAEFKAGTLDDAELRSAEGAAITTGIERQGA